jgi:hypothetical protein
LIINTIICAEDQLDEFIDSNKICGYWSLDPNTIDLERNLMRKCYIITKENTEDYYNKYIGKISLYIGGRRDYYDIISIERGNPDEYILDLGMTYGISRGTISIMSYGKIRLQFANQDTIFFEIINCDRSGGYYFLDFVGRNTLCYRAMIDNDLPEQDEEMSVVYEATHIVTRDDVPLYRDRVGPNTTIKRYLNCQDTV